jgi:lysozyme
MPKAKTGTNTYAVSGYGEPADRLRLKLVARAEGEKSQSWWLINRIRDAYAELYGDMDPQAILDEQADPPDDWEKKMPSMNEDLTKQSEGLKLTAYLCPAGKLTIGWGHTGPDVYPGMEISEEQAQDLLDNDLKNAEATVDHAVEPSLTDGQYSALVDFAFNLGNGALLGSTLLKLVNAGDFDGAAAEFLKWDKAHVDGELVELPGLLARRQQEQALFQS